MPAYPAHALWQRARRRRRAGARDRDCGGVDGRRKSSGVRGLSRPQAGSGHSLDRLARACGIRVAEFNSIDLNIPQDSPCFAGSDPLPLLEHADLGLLLDSDVRSLPQYAKRANAIKWIQIDIDALKADFPMWGFATDMRIQGDCATVLNQVLESGRSPRRRRLSQGVLPSASPAGAAHARFLITCTMRRPGCASLAPAPSAENPSRRRQRPT